MRCLVRDICPQKEAGDVWCSTSCLESQGYHLILVLPGISAPKRRPGMSDGLPLVWNLSAIIWSLSCQRYLSPKGGRGCLMFYLLSGISGLSFDSTLLYPLLLLCLLSLLFLSCLFCCLLVHPPDIFQKIRQYFFRKEVGFLIWLLFSSREITVGRWYVQYAAIWHCCLPLGVYGIFWIFVTVFVCFFFIKFF